MSDSVTNLVTLYNTWCMMINNMIDILYALHFPKIKENINKSSISNPINNDLLIQVIVQPTQQLIDKFNILDQLYELTKFNKFRRIKEHIRNDINIAINIILEEENNVISYLLLLIQNKPQYNAIRSRLIQLVYIIIEFKQKKNNIIDKKLILAIISEILSIDRNIIITQSFSAELFVNINVNNNDVYNILKNIKNQSLINIVRYHIYYCLIALQQQQQQKLTQEQHLLITNIISQIENIKELLENLLGDDNYEIIEKFVYKYQSNVNNFHNLNILYSKTQPLNINTIKFALQHFKESDELIKGRLSPTFDPLAYLPHSVHMDIAGGSISLNNSQQEPPINGDYKSVYKMTKQTYKQYYVSNSETI